MIWEGVQALQYLEELVKKRGGGLDLGEIIKNHGYKVTRKDSSLQEHMRKEAMHSTLSLAGLL